MEQQRPSHRRAFRGSKFAIALLAGVLVVPTAVYAAGGAFTDDDTSVFENDINWMADNGITTGCTPTQYCPDDNVTRGQMAAFMRRLATKKVVDAATAADADTLDGLDSTEITTLLFASRDTTNGGTSETAAGRIEVNSVAISVPLDGYLVISGGAFVNNQNGTDLQYALNAKLDGANALVQDWTAVTSFETGTEQNRGNFTYTITVPVTAGSHTVTQEVGPYSGTATFFHNQESLTIQYFPGTSSSVAPLVLSPSSTGGSAQG
jgi:hypothetical protein